MDQAQTGYRERLVPSAVGWLMILGTAVLLGLVLLPLGPVAAGAGVAVAVIGGVPLAVALSPVVCVRGGELWAGPAHIPVSLLAGATALRGEELRLALGPGLDATAYLCLRGWIGSALRVDVADPADPTPYWLVSTRRPELLLAAVDAARAAQARD